MPFGANESRIEVECRAFLRQRASEVLSLQNLILLGEMYGSVNYFWITLKN